MTISNEEAMFLPFAAALLNRCGVQAEAEGQERLGLGPDARARRFGAPHADGGLLGLEGTVAPDPG